MRYKNKMMETEVELVPKYIGGVELVFPQYKRKINKGDEFPELPIEIAKKRKDFVIIKRRMK